MENTEKNRMIKTSLLIILAMIKFFSIRSPQEVGVLYASVMYTIIILYTAYSLGTDNNSYFSDRLLSLMVVIAVLADIPAFLVNTRVNNHISLFIVIAYLASIGLGMMNKWNETKLVHDRSSLTSQLTNMNILLGILFALIHYQLFSLKPRVDLIVISYTLIYFILGIFSIGYISNNLKQVYQSSGASAGISLSVLSLGIITNCTTYCLTGWILLVSTLIAIPALGGITILGHRLGLVMYEIPEWEDQDIFLADPTLLYPKYPNY